MNLLHGLWGESGNQPCSHEVTLLLYYFRECPTILQVNEPNNACLDLYSIWPDFILCPRSKFNEHYFDLTSVCPSMMGMSGISPWRNDINSSTFVSSNRFSIWNNIIICRWMIWWNICRWIWWYDNIYASGFDKKSAGGYDDIITYMQVDRGRIQTIPLGGTIFFPVGCISGGQTRARSARESRAKLEPRAKPET